MHKLSKKNRNKIYRLGLKDHEEEIIACKNGNYSLDGMCENIRNAYYEIYGFNAKIRYRDLMDMLPEFIALKPKNVSTRTFWWATGNNSKTRLAKFKKIIKETD